jgi:hypothetical protein
VRVKNETRYQTRTLRTIFAAVYRDLSKHEGPLPGWRWYVFTVVYGNYSGCAPYNGTTQRIRIPKDVANVAEICAIAEHELLHNYGYTHKQMGGMHYPRGDWKAPAGLPEFISEKPVPKRRKHPGMSLQEHRHRLVLTGIERWEKKLKYAQNKLRKLRARRRYYERALAAKKART